MMLSAYTLSTKELLDLAKTGLVVKNQHGVYCCDCCGNPLPARTWPTESEKDEKCVTREYALVYGTPVPEGIKAYYANLWGRPWKDGP